jgi:hypothetical protein
VDVLGVPQNPGRGVRVLNLPEAAGQDEERRKVQYRWAVTREMLRADAACSIVMPAK